MILLIQIKINYLIWGNNTNYSPFPLKLRIWRQLQIEWFREMDQVSVEIGPFVNTFPHLMVVIEYISEMAVLFIE